MDSEALLRSDFGALGALLDDPSVEEVVVTSADKALVKRGGVVRPHELELSHQAFAEATDRLLKTLHFDPDSAPRVLRRDLSGDRRLIVVPRLTAPPLLRIELRHRIRSLREFAAMGVVAPEVEEQLTQRSTDSVLVFGGHGSAREAVAHAVLQQHTGDGRVVQLGSDDSGRLHQRALQEVLNPAEAIALGADVIFAPEVSAVSVAALLVSARPFVASLEAASESEARRRLLALALLGDGTVSRAAGEALLQSVALLPIAVQRVAPSAPRAEITMPPLLSEGDSRFDDVTPPAFGPGFSAEPELDGLPQEVEATAAFESKRGTIDLDPIDDEQDELTDARMLRDRGATVTGPPLEHDVPSEVRVAWAARGPSESREPLQAEQLLTHSAITPARDPVGSEGDAGIEPTEAVDATQAANLQEMLTGSSDLEADLIPPAQTQTHPWDVEKQDDAPFEDEKTPVASLFSGKRRRVRAQSSPDDDS